MVQDMDDGAHVNDLHAGALADPAPRDNYRDGANKGSSIFCS